MRRNRLLIVLTVLTLLVATCGGDDADVTTTGDATTSSTAPSTTAPPVVTTTAAPSTTSLPTTTTTTTTIPPTTTTTLPGEPFDIYPPEGAVVAVIGVAHDDVLNVREQPGLTTIVATLAPLADDVVSAGAGWKLPTTIWWKIVVAGESGWVNSSYIAYLGAVDDITSQVVAELGAYPSAATMAELGMIVAEAMASEDPASQIVMTVGPTMGDLGEVTYDVIGIGDDAQRGWRLHVFGTSDGDLTLKGIEATVLCGRGVVDDLCV